MRLLAVLLFLMMAATAFAQSLRYITGTSTTATGALAADSDGNVFAISTVKEPSGRSQMRAIKTDPQGTVLATFDFGGTAGDIPNASVVDAQGNLIVVGSTRSPDFPAVKPLASLSPALQASSQSAAFIVKIDSQLKNILIASKLGGTQGQASGTSDTTGTAIAIDAGGNVYVTGQ